MVVSQNFSSATSLAMFAPMRTVMVMPSFPRITSEISFKPSGPASTPYGDRKTQNSHKKFWKHIVCPIPWCPVIPKRRNRTLCILLWCLYSTKHCDKEGVHLDERHSHCILLDVVFDSVAHSHNELVRHHKDQDVGSFHRLHQVWNSQLRKRETNYGNQTKPGVSKI